MKTVIMALRLLTDAPERENCTTLRGKLSYPVHKQH